MPYKRHVKSSYVLRDAEDKQTAQAIQRLYDSIRSTPFVSSKLLDRLHAVCETLPKYDSSTPHVPDPHDMPLPFMRRK